MSIRLTASCLLSASLLVAGAALAGKAKVEVSHGSFEPDELTVATGDKVVFKNVVQMPGGHTIAFKELDIESGALDDGEKWSHTFEEAGTYRFFVKEHPDNKGTIVVE